MADQFAKRSGRKPALVSDHRLRRLAKYLTLGAGRFARKDFEQMDVIGCYLDGSKLIAGSETVLFRPGASREENAEFCRAWERKRLELIKIYPNLVRVVRSPFAKRSVYASGNRSASHTDALDDAGRDARLRKV